MEMIQYLLALAPIALILANATMIPGGTRRQEVRIRALDIYVPI
jgi:hypothetical protein